MEQWLIAFSFDHGAWFYIIIILLACAEGPWLSLISGVLLKLGYFNIFLIYASLMAGDLIGDVVWYWIGRHYGMRFVRRFGKYFSITEEGVKKIEHIFHKHKHSILFISKISNGFGFALVTLTTAGLVRIPFLRYMTVNLVGQFIWSGILIGVGYFMSQLYIQFDNILARMSIIAGFVVLVALFIGYKRYVRSRIEAIK